VSYQHEPGVERTQAEFLYPLVSFDQYGSQYRFHIVQFVSWSGGQGNAGLGKDRFTLFPFWFSQRSDDPAESYRALVPFYGHLKGRLFRDEIRFVAMPLWVQTRKRDVVTDNYFAPFVHVRTGAAQGWQVWPLYGQEHRAPLVRTNALSDLPEVVPGHEKRQDLVANVLVVELLAGLRVSLLEQEREKISRPPIARLSLSLGAPCVASLLAVVGPDRLRFANSRRLDAQFEWTENADFEKFRLLISFIFYEK
jgi:hypothetical protein